MAYTPLQQREMRNRSQQNSRGRMGKTMSAPHFTILTQKELTIDLSRPAMRALLEMSYGCGQLLPPHVSCELDNFRNALQNLLERSEPKAEKFDLIGE
jgi:hypothetical protein